ncbi:NAD-dependent epimerase/dehydratase family protein [Microvirga sp. G4-2]|uniref:NAD-dependent epimerase/dehydratase family protein n=1 Tax=Microvirga sp. G4-2 TaxID=3434467 RepID=UPI004043E487
MPAAANSIVVTGAGGFLGSAVAGRLRAKGACVIGLDLKDDEARGVIACDLSRVKSLEAVLQDVEFDSIIHCGAISGPMLHRDEPGFVVRVNISGTLNLLEWARRKAIRRFVFCSSGSVYGARDPVLPVAEDTPLHPTSAYAASKIAGEALVEAYRAAYGVDGVSLRIAAIYGPGRRTACHIHDMLTAALTGRRLDIAHGRDQRFHYIHVDDAARAVLAALSAARIARPAYTIAGDNGVTLGTLAEVVRQHLPHVEVAVGGGLDPLSDVQGPYELTAASADLGWRPTVSLGDGIRRYANWLAEQVQNN